MLSREVNGAYLTLRESDLLYYLVRGKSAKEIAKLSGVSFRTIEDRMNTVKQKLGVSRKGELIERVVDLYLNPN